MGPLRLSPCLKPNLLGPRGTKNRGLHAGPIVSQAHETVALSSSTLQRDGSSAKAVPLFAHSQGPVEVRAGVEAFSGEYGRAFEIKAQSLPNPSPPSDAIVGCNLKGRQVRKGKAPMVQTRGSTQKEEKVVSKKMWTTLFPPSFDRRQGLRSRIEPLFLRKSLSFSEVRNLEEDFGTGSQMERGFRASPLFRCHLSRNQKWCSGEGTSSSRGEADPRNPHFEEDKEGFLGRVGSDFRGSSVTDLPSNPEIRGKGLIFEGICEIPGVENMEVCLSSPSQPPESSSISSCSLALPLPSPSGPDLPSFISLSQSPTKINKSKPNSPKKVSNMVTGSHGDTVASPSGEFLIDGLSPRKWLKCERFYALWILSWNTRGLGSRNKRRVVKDFLRSENSNVVMIQETKKEKCDRRFVVVSGRSEIRNGWLFRRAGLQGQLFPQGLQEALLRRTSIIGQLFWIPTRSSGAQQLLALRESYRESWSIEGLDWSPISEENALRLDSPFTEEEISKAIFQLNRDKASGPDGFTIAVFQDCWDVIKEDLVRVFAKFHRSGIINQSTNASFIVLLPKKSLTKKISNFRPISLITSLYKIIVEDAILIANEIVDERRRSREEGVVFKIDFEKAYDHMSWDFLDQMLENKGFSPRWRKWMSGLFVLVSYAVLVNGNAKGEEELQTLKSLLLVFGHISGLKVNLDKSNINGINLDQNHLSRLAEMLDCKASGWPILYLGLPLGGNPRRVAFGIQ
ncbi:Transposon TX1 uncharacterized 149 kDa protein [Vitis vinifera]|uniref:Transposon TX1 uncharacterized 149 kDa protein n=1 Tax=Vitis vinifera TaxID=29760 RepID=A0A438K400_VITVI|nr:Transposon TX1 uncharacterized 149 kDa protein [Vitis vinifera]